jgi:hypothetical protein
VNGDTASTELGVGNNLRSPNAGRCCDASSGGEDGVAQCANAAMPTSPSTPPLALPPSPPGDDVAGAIGLKPVPSPPVIVVTTSDSQAWPYV